AKVTEGPSKIRTIFGPGLFVLGANAEERGRGQRALWGRGQDKRTIVSAWNTVTTHDGNLARRRAREVHTVYTLTVTSAVTLSYGFNLLASAIWP
ncbi:MAG: hypothetical protein LKJ42_09340, partial [Ancrocorticia sp.]|nr:hypothetical protein [Ancrocorticia sp.]